MAATPDSSDSDRSFQQILAIDEPHVKECHFHLLGGVIPQRVPHEQLTNSPLFTAASVRQSLGQTLPALSQYGLLGCCLGDSAALPTSPPVPGDLSDSRLFCNTTTPSSTFICGSQGSGKSHTLSCLLENYLVASDAATLPHPLTALVFHYDTFVSDDAGVPSEAAFLASLSGIRVRVLCSPTNTNTIKVRLARCGRTIR